MNIRCFSPDDTKEVVALWERCGLTRAWNDPRKDIERKLKIQPELFLVACEGERVVGSVMGGYDGHRGWVNYLAVDPDCRLKGVGRKLMGQVEEGLKAMGCPKLNLQVRAANAGAVAFYRALGFKVDEVVSLGKRLVADEPGA